MRRIILLLFAILPLFAVAQNDIKVALLETLNGDKRIQVEGIEMNMVRGELRKAITNQNGYKAFTRADIDILMKEHNFQNSGMVSDDQRKQLGKMSGADYICVSTLTKSNTQYGMLKDGTYANLFQLCQDLAQELIGNVSSETSRVFIDLGLPTGTLWSDQTEDGLYTQDEAIRIYKNSLPTIKELSELKEKCTWTVVGNQYKVTGPNGRFILLSANGNGEAYDGYRAGEFGVYWSSTTLAQSNVSGLGFYISEEYYFLWDFKPLETLSVRLVKRE